MIDDAQRDPQGALEPDAGRVRIERVVAPGIRLGVDVAGGPAEKLAERAFASAAGEVRAALKPPAEDPVVPQYAGIVGASPPMRDLFRMLERIKNSDATVLVLGDNGTGKELVARAIHEQSRRAKNAFVATNCSAFNDNLLESELFGHRRGAFTGAVVDKPGLFQVADGGTFFMDEVGDMSPALQVKLLRVLQEGVFMPVGGTEHRQVDVRIIAATNRDLGAMVRVGTFREDLYYRLHVVTLKVPPLRDRAEDIPLLTEYFLRRLAAREGGHKVLTERALAALMVHDWPGNVRELENEMERTWVLSGTDLVIDEDVLSPSVRRTRPGAPAKPAAAPARAPEVPSDASLPDAVEALERAMIAAELERSRGNKTRAAAALGISRRNLIRKVQTYELEDGKKGRAVSPLVAIAEVDPFHLRMLEEACAAAGFEVATAGDARAALDLLARQRPSLLVLDLALTTSDPDVLAIVRDDLSLGRIPVVVTATREDEAACVIAVERGADDYLVRPYRALEVQLRVKNLIRMVTAERLAARGIRSAGAMEDELTHAGSAQQLRISLEYEATRALRYGHALTCVVVRAAGLAAVRRAEGPAGADGLLARLATELRLTIRGIDHLFRSDVDELTLLLPETPIEGAVHVVERLRVQARRGELGAGMALEVGCACLTAGRATDGGSLYRSALDALAPVA